MLSQPGPLPHNPNSVELSRPADFCKMARLWSTPQGVHQYNSCTKIYWIFWCTVPVVCGRVGHTIPNPGSPPVNSVVACCLSACCLLFLFLYYRMAEHWYHPNQFVIPVTTRNIHVHVVPGIINLHRKPADFPKHNEKVFCYLEAQHNQPKNNLWTPGKCHIIIIVLAVDYSLALCEQVVQ